MQILRASAPALVGALLVAGAPAPAGAGLFNPISFTLENGLEVVVIEDHRAPVVTHMVWYRVGAADEEPGKSGLAHFLEHLMFKGTDEVAAGEFSRLIARNGGRDNAFTSQDYTGYYQSMARDKLELVMRLEADRMVNLKLDEKDVQTEREVVLEERRQRTDNEPGAQLGEAASAAQYLAHPYGIPVIGWEHEIRGLTRAAALAFYQRYYAPNNAILIVAGDVSADAVRRLGRGLLRPAQKARVAASGASGRAAATGRAPGRARGCARPPAQPQAKLPGAEPAHRRGRGLGPAQHLLGNPGRRQHQPALPGARGGAPAGQRRRRLLQRASGSTTPPSAFTPRRCPAAT